MTQSQRLPSVLRFVLLVCVLLVSVLPLAHGQALVSLTSSLSSTQTPISPTFDSYTFDYTQTVASTATSITVRAVLNSTAADAGANITAVWNSDAPVLLQSGQDSQAFTLASLNFLSLTVRQASAADVTYILTVTRPSIVSRNANLLGLTLLTFAGATPSSQTDLISSISPSTFSSQQFGYAVQLASGVTGLRFVATVDAQATLHYTTTRTALSPLQTFAPTASQGLISGSQSGAISVFAGQQQRIDIRVIAQDGVTARNYAYVVGNNADPAPTAPTVNQYDESADGTSSSTGSTQPDSGALLSAGHASVGVSHAVTALLALMTLVAFRR